MSNLAILADSKTQNPSLFPVHAMFRHDCPLTVKLASMQWNLSNKKKKTWRDSAPIDMFLSAVSVLVVVQQSSEVPEGLMNYPVYTRGVQKVMSHIFFLGNYLLRMYAIHAQYNWMFPLHMWFFHIISIYVYSLTPGRNKSMHAFPVPARFLLTLRRLMSYIYGAPILDVSRSHTTTQHSR